MSAGPPQIGVSLPSATAACRAPGSAILLRSVESTPGLIPSASLQSCLRLRATPLWRPLSPATPTS